MFLPRLLVRVGLGATPVSKNSDQIPPEFRAGRFRKRCKTATERRAHSSRPSNRAFECDRLAPASMAAVGRDCGKTRWRHWLSDCVFRRAKKLIARQTDA